jgi:hypothetical protein
VSASADSASDALDIDIAEVLLSQAVLKKGLTEVFERRPCQDSNGMVFTVNALDPLDMSK